VHKKIISAVKRAEFVSDRMSYIILRGHKYNNYTRNLVNRSFGTCLRNRLLSGSSMRFTVRSPEELLMWGRVSHIDISHVEAG
jgi:hypothetical protein